jgi:hypothetical protein
MEMHGDLVYGNDAENTKRRGRPKGRTALNSFIENGVERRKYFVNRIKAMRSKAENFAYCTNSEFLLLGIDESGMCHHWETDGMLRFIQDSQIQDAMFQVVCQNHGAPPPDLAAEELSIQQVAQIKAARLAGQKNPSHGQQGDMSAAQAVEEAEHLRSLLRQKVAMMPLPDQSPRIYGNEDHRPPEWLAAVPFVEPSALDHGTLLAVLQQFVAFEHAYAQQHEHLQAQQEAQVHADAYSHQFADQQHYVEFAQQQQYDQQHYDQHPQHYEQQAFEQQYAQQYEQQYVEAAHGSQDDAQYVEQQQFSDQQHYVEQQHQIAEGSV